VFGVANDEAFVVRPLQNNGLAAFSIEKGSQTIVLEASMLEKHVFLESKEPPGEEF
jgi:hypothetical protein